MTQIIQCIPNFSEGRDARVMTAIVKSARETPGATVADWSADFDHNRMVVTILGDAKSVKAAAIAAAGVAIREIDITNQDGVHPKLGVLDVLPFVPIKNVSLEGCAKLAREIGKELAERYQIPIFFYEATSAEKRDLPTVRREAFRSLTPDCGPSAPHPTAGASVVGARGPLIAFNVNLKTEDVTIAREIAREVRNGAGAEGFRGVRALGLKLSSRSITQVSMNVTRPAQTSLLAVFSYIARRASELGTEALESEMIGVMPEESALAIVREILKMPTLHSGQVLWENML